jgi:hypothetical protein
MNVNIEPTFTEQRFKSRNEKSVGLKPDALLGVTYYRKFIHFHGDFFCQEVSLQIAALIS